MKYFILGVSILFSIGSFAEPVQVTIEFNSSESALEYINWMSGQGEQDMSIWMDENRPSLSILPNYDYENLVIDFTEEVLPERD